jgi:hypothetical protein
MKLPKSFTTITPFSKTLALTMFIIFPVLGFFYGRYYQKTLDAAPDKLVPPVEQITPQVTKKHPDFQPLYYYATTVDATNSAVFHDPYLNISFNYPQGMLLRALESSKKNDYTNVYLMDKDTDPDYMGNIEDFIDCDRQNIINPDHELGLCHEGSIADIEISISEADPLSGASGKAYAADPYCTRSDAENIRVYSCLTRDIKGNPAFSYAVYKVTNGKTFGLTVSADSSSEQEAMMTIISSFRAE